MKKTNDHRWLFGALAAGLLAALPLAAPGQTTPQQSPLAQARKAVTDAKAEVAKDKQLLDRARVKVEAAFGRDNPDYAAAQKAYEKALFDLKLATSQALAKLQSSPDYIAALKAKQDAKDKQAALTNDSKATPEDQQVIFNEVFARAKVVTELETAATANDQKILDAKQRVADSKQTLDDFKAKLDSACAADPDYQQALQTEAGAEQQVTQAEQSFQEQAKAQAEAAAAAAKARSSSSSTPGAPPARRY